LPSSSGRAHFARLGKAFLGKVSPKPRAARRKLKTEVDDGCNSQKTTKV